ncbi:MAG: hypothetical protein KBS96_06490 [Lachnospiraceae bacterium]|nr:hypothetical protein [Candidatus Colinaster scatohippi]
MNQLKEIIRKDDETKRFIRCRQGVELYNMSRPQFVKLAIEAGAAYKINLMILVDKNIFEQYAPILIY